MSLLLLLGGFSEVVPVLTPGGLIEGAGATRVIEPRGAGSSIEGRSVLGATLVEGQSGIGG